MNLTIVFSYVFGHRITMVPLNDEGYDEMASPPAVRLRTGTIGSEDFNDKGANLHIDMDNDQKKSIKAQMFSCKSLCITSSSLRALALSLRMLL